CRAGEVNAWRRVLRLLSADVPDSTEGRLEQLCQHEQDGHRTGYPLKRERKSALHTQDRGLRETLDRLPDHREVEPPIGRDAFPRIWEFHVVIVALAGGGLPHATTADVAL